jgi:hypothetical protein
MDPVVVPAAVRFAAALNSTIDSATASAIARRTAAEAVMIVD